MLVMLVPVAEPILTVLALALVPISICPVVPVSRVRPPVVPVITFKALAAEVVISVAIVPLRQIPLVDVPAVLVRFSRLVDTTCPCYGLLVDR